MGGVSLEGYHISWRDRNALAARNIVGVEATLACL